MYYFIDKLLAGRHGKRRDLESCCVERRRPKRYRLPVVVVELKRYERNGWSTISLTGYSEVYRHQLRGMMLLSHFERHCYLLLNMVMRLAWNPKIT